MTHPTDDQAPVAVDKHLDDPAAEPGPVKRVVLVDRAGGWLAELPSLGRSNLHKNHVIRAEQAIALCRRRRNDVVAATYPMPDMHLDEFVSSLRAGRSPSSQPHIVILASDRDLARLTGYADESLSFISSDLRLEAIETSLMEIIDEPRRVAARLMARFEATLKSGTVLRLCQTIDISRTGILVQTHQLLPIGATVSLELTLDEGEQPIVVEAEIVRHAKEPTVGRGMGLRFTRFEAGAKARLLQFLSRPAAQL